jgi:L-ascorbate metabolism protein UlaG (beta-lactamase superfamily)
MNRNTLFYLKQNVKAEPLFNQWYAWPHLIAPATAAMIITNSHLRIMKSYVSAPQIHANAVKNPALVGGPFIDYEGRRANEIEELVEKTAREQAGMIKFCESVVALDELLRNEAKGYCLEPLYRKVPDNLRGLVEVVYDLNDNPSIRFSEGLLYRSEYYNPASQALALSQIHTDARAFALSTPRLPDSRTLQLDIPFNHEGVDALFSMKHEPQSFGYISELLGLKPQQQELFSSFLTEQQPPARPRFSGPGVAARYYGHACVSIETSDVCIFTDPVLSYAYESSVGRYTYLNLPETIDYVLLTHGHQDHMMFETLLQIRHKVKNVVVPRSQSGALQDPSLKLVLQNIGFKNVVELSEMESIPIEGGSITGLPFLGEHADLNISSKLAYLVRAKEKSFLFAADSNNIEPKLYQRLFDCFGGIDLLFLGMECDGAPLSWLYGPLMTRLRDRKMDQSRRLSGSNYEKAIAIVDQFNCKQVYVYAMGQEPWLGFVMGLRYTEASRPIIESNKLVEACRARGLVSERLLNQKEIIA